jgi:hypothetical protein
MEEESETIVAMLMMLPQLIKTISNEKKVSNRSTFSVAVGNLRKCQPAARKMVNGH